MFSYFSNPKYQVTRRGDDDDGNGLRFFTYKVLIPPCTLEYGKYSIHLEVRLKEMLWCQRYLELDSVMSECSESTNESYSCYSLFSQSETS